MSHTHTFTPIFSVSQACWYYLPIQSHQGTATALWKDLWSAGWGREGFMILPGHWVGETKMRAVEGILGGRK